MYEMFFNTGVKRENRLDKEGNLIRYEFDDWSRGVLRIKYYIESEPPKNSRLDYLAQDDKHLNPSQMAIKIVGGGMISEYAIFTVFSV